MAKHADSWADERPPERGSFFLEAVANELTLDLFSAGARVADRLALVGREGLDLGSWQPPAVRDRVLAALRRVWEAAR